MSYVIAEQATVNQQLTVQTEGKCEVSRSSLKQSYLNTITALAQQAKEESQKK